MHHSSNSSDFFRELHHALKSKKTLSQIVANPKIMAENKFCEIYGGRTPEAQAREPLVMLARAGKYALSYTNTRDCCIVKIGIQKVVERKAVGFASKAPPAANSPVALKEKQKRDALRWEILKLVLQNKSSVIQAPKTLALQQKHPLFIVAYPGAYKLEANEQKREIVIQIPLDPDHEPETESQYSTMNSWAVKPNSLSSTMETSSSKQSLYTTSSTPQMTRSTSNLRHVGTSSADYDSRFLSPQPSSSTSAISRWGSASTLTYNQPSVHPSIERDFRSLPQPQLGGRPQFVTQAPAPMYSPINQYNDNFMFSYPSSRVDLFPTVSYASSASRTGSRIPRPKPAGPRGEYFGY